MADADILVKTLQAPRFHEDVFRAAKRAIEVTPAMAPAAFDDEWLEQAVTGFINLAVEAAGGDGRETRVFFLETVVPGMVAEGQMPASLIRATVTFLSLVGNELSVHLPTDARATGGVWFATFAGNYIEDLYGVLAGGAA